MKIAFLSFYSGIVARGAETFVHELSNSLTRLGHEVTVFQVGKELTNAKYKTVTISLEVNWSRSSSYFLFGNYYSLKVAQFTIKSLKKIDKNTEVIFPVNGQWESVLASLWAKINKKKIVISGQSGPGIDDRINTWTFPNCFVGLTDFQSEWAKKANPFIKVSKIPNGVNLDDFKKEERGLRFNLPRPLILCVSALDPWKRIDLVTKAVAKLDSGSLLVVGKGPEESYLKKLGENLLQNRFLITSFKHFEMPKVYRSADLFVFSTVPWESFGIVLVEAMASGLPVVATNDPIREEIVGGAGILINPENTDEFSLAMEKALREKWGSKPREQAKKFDWRKIAKKYEELFNTL